MTIGQRIKFRREELNLSQEDLAKKIGYKSRSSINKIELDLYNLKQSKIKIIADALKTTPAYIMGWEEQEQKCNKIELDVLTQQAIDLYLQLDINDQAEIRGEMKQMLKAEKYFAKDALSNKKMA